ncbi:MAG: NAD(P)H-hydrate dehydratase [Candidatus Firestonebacteria bacterium]
MKIVSGRLMRKIDKTAVLQYKIPSLELMENAGREVVSFLSEKFPLLPNLKVLVLCGKGNNGGDGFVISRLLLKKGINVSVFLLTLKSFCEGEVKTNLKKLLKAGCKITEVADLAAVDRFKEEVKSADLIVDAILGTGFEGRVSLIYGKVIEIINSLEKKIIVSVDVPSGLNSDNGQVSGPCIVADYTVALGLVKLGLVVSPGINFTGELIVKDIGIPSEAVQAENINLNYVTQKDAGAFCPKRVLDLNKGRAGKILVVGGSAGLTGAPCLTAQSALRTGSGIVTVACAKGLNGIFEIKLTEVMTRPLPQNIDGSLSSKAAVLLLEMMGHYDVLALGPGLGKNKDTGKLVHNLIRKVKNPVVLDADGLNFISKDPEVLKEKKGVLVVTPHPGEMSRLMGCSVDMIQKYRVEASLKFAKKYNVITLLKGARTVIALPSGEVYINSTGNPGMATAGAGDVLTGVIASIIGQGMEPGKAAIFGAFIHGLAGDFAREDKGECGLIASDIISNIPKAILNIKKAAR